MAATVNVAVAGAVTVTPAGCVVMAGATGPVALLVIVKTKAALTEAPPFPVLSQALIVIFDVPAQVGVPPILPFELVSHNPGVRGKTAVPFAAVLALQECAVCPLVVSWRL